MKNKTVLVLGLGYIGLPTAALIANNGYNVIGVDLNPAIVSTVNDGNIHIVEPGLDSIVKSAIESKRLRCTTVASTADIYLICVPTPLKYHDSNRTPDLDFVVSAVDSISPFLKAGDMIILESTSPVGTTDLIKNQIAQRGIDTHSLKIAYCPERVLPGNIINEIVENDRIVGGLSAEATKEVAAFYRTLVKGRVLETDAKTAEMCKLTENSFRDLNIAFANEISMICAAENINVYNLINLANLHPRVNILQPGVGVGGHCIAIDPWFIVSRHPDISKLIRLSRVVNISKTEWVIDHIQLEVTKYASRLGRNPVIACLGLTFKPNIDDLRESPAMQIVKALMNSGQRVLCVEPNVDDVEGLTLVDLDIALRDADIIAVLVKHDDFLAKSIQENLRLVNAIDYCGLFE